MVWTRSKPIQPSMPSLAVTKVSTQGSTEKGGGIHWYFPKQPPLVELQVPPMPRLLSRCFHSYIYLPCSLPLNWSEFWAPVASCSSTFPTFVTHSVKKYFLLFVFSLHLAHFTWRPTIFVLGWNSEQAILYHLHTPYDFINIYVVPLELFLSHSDVTWFI